MKTCEELAKKLFGDTAETERVLELIGNKEKEFPDATSFLYYIAVVLAKV